MRNLDLASLRSLVSIADTGGVTRAASALHLTQSAVSMQIRRLEDSMGITLLERVGRGVALTASGEQLVGYARRMLALNDEVYSRLTSKDFEGEIVLGVPHDIVYPALPGVLQEFAAMFPRMRVSMISSFTKRLKAQFERGEVDIILTTEDRCDPGGEELERRQLVWVGAPGGQAWRQTPVPLAFERDCAFRQGVQQRLDDAGIAWQMRVDSDNSRTVEATVSADLAIHALLEGTRPAHMERVAHDNALPELWDLAVNLYIRPGAKSQAIDALADALRRAYRRNTAQPKPKAVA